MSAQSVEEGKITDEFFVIPIRADVVLNQAFD